MRKFLEFLSTSTLVSTLPAFMTYQPSGVWITLASLASIGIMYVILSRRRMEVRAVIDKVEKMPDGSYLVTWGYVNPNTHPICVQHGESCLLVHSGTALLLSKDIPVYFAAGRHRNVIQTVVLENTYVEWIIGSQRTSSKSMKPIQLEST